MSEENTRQLSSARRTLLKMVVLGDSGVGKTALLYRYVEGRFIETHQATIGADLLTKVVTLGNTSVNLQIWDTAGQERYDSLGSAYYRGTDGCIFVYDISNKESFAHLEHWRENFLNNAGDSLGSGFKFLLLGNKCDLPNEARKVSTNEGSNYAQTNKMLFFETSASNSINVNDAFMTLIQEISKVEEEVLIYSTEMSQKLKSVDPDVDTKHEKPSANCGCSII